MSPHSIGLLVHDLCKPVSKSFIGSSEHDIHQARSESFISAFLRGDHGSQLPLGEQRTHFLCDLSFLRWLLEDKLDWNEEPLSKEHQQLRWNYNALFLDSILTRTMDTILTYDVILNNPELMAGSKLWLNSLKSVKNDLVARDDLEDSMLLQKLEAVVRLLMKADDLSKRKEVKDLSQLTDAFALAAMFRRFKVGGDFDWDLSISLLICALEHRVRTDSLHKAAQGSDTVWPTNDHIGDLIEDFQDDYTDNFGYKPDYLERLLRVRPKLDILENFDRLHDLDAIVNLLEEAQVRQYIRGSKSGNLSDSIPDARSVGAQHDFKILSFLLLESVYGLTKMPTVQAAMGLRFDDVDCVAEQLINRLCHYDLDDDLERMMSIVRKLRYLASIRKLSTDEQTTAFPQTLQTFLQNLPPPDRYDQELRQNEKHLKADKELTETGKMALCQESHGREKSGWDLDAASFLVLLDAKAAFMDIFPGPHIKRDFDVEHELRIMPPILRSYPLDEVHPSPALYHRFKAAKKKLQLLDGNDFLVEELAILLGTMEQRPEIQAMLAKRKEQKREAMTEDRIAHGKLSGYSNSKKLLEVSEAPIDPDWRVVQKSWSQDISFLISLLRRKLAQVSRKAAWSIVPGASFIVDRQIQYMLKILLSYENANMHGESDFEAELEEIRGRLGEFEYLSEREREGLDRLIVKIGFHVNSEAWGSGVCRPCKYTQKEPSMLLRRSNFSFLILSQAASFSILLFRFSSVSLKQ